MTQTAEQRQEVCDAWNAAFRSHDFAGGPGTPVRCIRCGILWHEETSFDAVIEDTDAAKAYHCKEKQT